MLKINRLQARFVTIGYPLAGRIAEQNQRWSSEAFHNPSAQRRAFSLAVCANCGRRICTAFLIVLSTTALPAHAGLEDMVKDAIKNEIDRRMPMGAPKLVFDLPERSPASYNLHWRIAGRAGPFTYRDDRLEDGYAGRLSFRPQGGINSLRPENMKKFSLEIRKVF